MPAKLINLRDVPEDEAQELRELLQNNNIRFYETSAGNWRFSVPAIWLHDKNQLQRARTLIEKYQAERFARARGEYEALQREGKNKTLIDEIMENPGRFTIYLISAALIIYLSIKPFTDIGK